MNRPKEWISNMDLTRIQHDQERVVLKYLADSLSPVDWENLTTLVTDGGDLSPTDLAEQNERHVDSVRRSLRRMEELLDREYDRVRLRSPFIDGLSHRRIELAREAARNAAEATAKVAYAAERELDEHTIAFIVSSTLGGLMPTTPVEPPNVSYAWFLSGENTDVISEQGYDLWFNAGRNPGRFHHAWPRPGGGRGDGITNPIHWISDIIMLVAVALSSGWGV